MEEAPARYAWEEIYSKWTHRQLLDHLVANGISELDEQNSNKLIAIGFLVQNEIPPEGEDDGRSG